MTNKHDWLSKRTLRKVQNLRLWAQNPRLDPEGVYVTTKDFAEEITYSEADKNNFIDLVKSIAAKGYIPADPIVVWQNEENQKFYVAEGNRRILALKLLLDPTKCPKNIRSTITRISEGIDKENFERVPVSISPTFDDAEWYISQRNSLSSLQQVWSYEQQFRWVEVLYEKYSGNIEAIKEVIDLTESELYATLRALKIKGFLTEAAPYLTEDEFEKASSHRFPLSTLKRFFDFKDVRELWGVEYLDFDVNLTKDKESFYRAFAELIRRMLMPKGEENRIDSRAINNTSVLEKVLASLPTVDDASEVDDEENSGDLGENDDSESPNEENEGEEKKDVPKPQRVRNNPYRSRLIPDFYRLESSSHKINDLFSELQIIPLRYKNSIAASIRIMLDLAVLFYIKDNNLEEDLKNEKHQSNIRLILLKTRIDYLKNKISNPKVKNIMNHLLNEQNQYSLDVLNGYIHTEDTHYLNPTFLNNFWDFVFPLMVELIPINEIAE